MKEIMLKDVEAYGRDHGFDEMFIKAPGQFSGEETLLEAYDYSIDFSTVDTRNRTIKTTPETVVYLR